MLSNYWTGKKMRQMYYHRDLEFAGVDLGGV